MKDTETFQLFKKVMSLDQAVDEHEYDQFQMLSSQEHVLKRPDLYIGGMDPVTEPMWIVENQKIVRKTITYVPGFVQLFDEILVNAGDNQTRGGKMSYIKVEVTDTTISIANNGQGIPIVKHPEHDIYIPQMVFAHFHTSSNYNDEKKRVTGGRNGVGAKATNIHSSTFTIEVIDSKHQLSYKQVCRQNMTVVEPPKIKKTTRKTDEVKITYAPDGTRFSVGLTEDVKKLFQKRLYEMAGVTAGVTVYWNKEKIPIRDFKDYILHYETDLSKRQILYEKTDRWEYAVLPNNTSDPKPHVSLVNKIATLRGGTHVKDVLTQISKPVAEILAKKSKVNIQPLHVKNHTWLFLNCLVENPSFDSQTKTYLTTPKSKFGSKVVISEGFIKKFTQSEIADAILTWNTSHEIKQLQKMDGKKKRSVNVPKLDDAHNAGTAKSEQTTLILTEGDSAKHLAIAGMSVVGREDFGVFPMRGKDNNVADKSMASILKMTFIANLCLMLGLKHGTTYTNTKSLRYGRLLLMTDQDADGHHIKGLILMIFAELWPSLLELSGFLQFFATPLIKCTKGNTKGNTRIFFNVPQYETWAKSTEGQTGKWGVKYYKGLATSTRKEGIEYFSNLDQYVFPYVYTPQCLAALQLAFRKKQSNQRKEWLQGYDPTLYLDYQHDELSYHNFVHKELKLYSWASLHRAIPKLMDGLKPVQRKILYTMIKKNIVNDIKLPELVGKVSDIVAYHNGDSSLHKAIISLAQDFVGSNNCNYLMPSGQFGSRLMGTSSAGAPRYLQTRLSPLIPYLFPKVDQGLVTLLEEDGRLIEPEWMLPCLPTVLMNGCKGIATGWATTIPNYHPLHLVRAITELLEGKEVTPLLPWYRDFTGTVKQEGKHIVLEGKWETTETGIRIKELPIGLWTDPYIDNVHLKGTKSSAGLQQLKDKGLVTFKNHSIDRLVDIEITCETPVTDDFLYKTLRLRQTFVPHLVMYAENRIRSFNSAEEVIQSFYEKRLQYYEKRRLKLIADKKEEAVLLENKVKYIRKKLAGYSIVGKSREVVTQELREDNFHESSRPFQYLLSMTDEMMLRGELQEKLFQQVKALQKEIETLTKETSTSLWKHDLDIFVSQWEANEKQRLVDLQTDIAKQTIVKSKKRKRPTKKPQKHIKKPKVTTP